MEIFNCSKTVYNHSNPPIDKYHYNKDKTYLYNYLICICYI
ncbi:MAG TPA: hypothetical protein PLK25_00115 [Bacteroidales bacterium]|nr:hypothetical protein [Bacteroidales bacterium]HOV54902.1 hypothetical protein [Bacteroidales bacterium]HRC78101.1 hypothetical protein [Bacteroidales bacterium]HRT72601.1 hypothetical protein [Bacteroidales bacterium]